MSFRLPNRIPSKRASSFHIKKITTPTTHAVEDTELLLIRQQGSTPNTTKNNRAQSTAEMSSPLTVSRQALHHHLFDTPKSRRLDSKQTIESRMIYLSELHEKFSPLPKPSLRQEEARKTEEKLFSRIQQLTNENELLKVQLNKFKSSQEVDSTRHKSTKDLKIMIKAYKSTVENFVLKVKYNFEKLCKVLEQQFGDFHQVQAAKSCFDQELKLLVPLFGLEILKTHSFSNIDCETGENTGRFRSLSETQHSFTTPNHAGQPGEVIAMSEYEAKHHGELSFKLGDRIQVIKTDDPDWWLGRLSEKVGRIPSKLMMLD